MTAQLIKPLLSKHEGVSSPCEQLGVVACACVPSAGKIDRPSQGSPASQSSRVIEPQANERPVSKQSRWMTPERRPLRSFSGLHTHAQTQMRVCRLAHKGEAPAADSILNR